jgi:hypothetical protein
VSRSSIRTKVRRRIFERDQGRCQYRRLSQIGQSATLHINHVIPRSKNGVTDEGNLVLQCPYCSLHKADTVSAPDPQTGECVSLFHPLTQAWTDHFRVEKDALIRGISPCGRATLVALSMNDFLPRFARLLQIRLGLLTTSMSELPDA